MTNKAIDNEKTAAATLKTVAADMRATLERINRLEATLRSVKGDIEQVAKAHTQHLFIQVYTSGKWDKVAITDWLAATNKRIDEVL
jgi:hypothetical protein